MSGTTMLTSAAVQKNSKNVGTVTVDIGITELEDYVKGIQVGQNGYAFLVSQDGFYLVSRDDSKNMKAKITEESSPALSSLGQKIISLTEVSLTESDVFGEDSYVMAAPSITSWKKQPRLPTAISRASSASRVTMKWAPSALPSIT